MPTKRRRNHCPFFAFMRSLLSKPDSRVIMISRKLLAFIFTVVFISSLVMLPAVRVNAASSGPIAFSSGLTLYSPVNTTYSSKIINCSGTFIGPKDYEISLNYSIDGSYQGYLPWTLNQNATNSANYTLDWSFQLPQLSRGAHQLSIGIEQQLFGNNDNILNQKTSVDTSYFSISSSQPTSAVLEFSLLAVLVVIVGVLSVVAYLRHRKRNLRR